MDVGKSAGSLSRNVVILGIVSFLNDLSSEMIIPILPMFITSLGGGGLAIGAIGGLRESIASLLKVICGWWSDTTGRRKIFLSSGYALSSGFKLLLALSKTWQQVLVFAGLERVGKGMRTAPRDAIIADSMPGTRGKAFGIHRALDTLGALLGSVLVFLLYWFLGLDLGKVILIAALVAFSSLLPIYFVREIKGKPQFRNLKVNLMSLPHNLRLFILAATIFTLGNFSYMFFILRAQHLFEGRLAIGAPILLYVLFNIFYAGFALPFGLLSDRIGRRPVLVVGYGLFAGVCFGFVFLDSRLAFGFLFALYGIVHAIVDGNQRAMVSDLAPAQIKATALGAFHTATGLATLPASLLAGILWQVKPEATFAYGAIVSLAAVVALLIWGTQLKV